MSKIVLNNLADLGTSAVSLINNNNDAIEIAIENTLSRDGTTPNAMDSNLDMNSYRILNLPEPIAATEPIRLGDIDLDAVEEASANAIIAQAAAVTAVASATAAVNAANLAESVTIGSVYLKSPVVVASTNPITLSGEQTIDGVAIVTGQRVLVKDQYNEANNGIYVCSSSTWTRAGDYDSSGEVAGSVIFVVSGTKNKGSLWRCTSQSITLGSTLLYFTKDYSGRTLSDASARQSGVISQIGDSNTDNVNGHPAWETAIDLEWFGVNAPLEGWTNYNIGNNGSSIVSWVSNINGGSSATAVTTRGNPWAAINADPDIIVVALGTNDFGLDANQATNGVLATARINFAKLLSFLLAGSRAAIWLRMPQPFAFENGTGITWADANEAADYSSRLRTLYQEWIGVNNRITVYDSHTDLFGLRVDDKTTDALDPVASAEMLEDSLHLTSTGYRRMAQRMTKQLVPSDRHNLKFTRTSSAIHMAQRFAVPCYISNSEVGGTILTIRSEPQKLFKGISSDLIGSAGTALLVDLPLLDAMFGGGHHSARGELLAYHVSTVKIYFPGTGTTYSPTTFRFNDSTVGGSGETQDRFVITGTTISELGTALIYTENWYDNPYAQRETLNVAVSRTTDIVVPFMGKRGLRAELYSVDAARIGFVAGVGSFDTYYFSSNSGSVTGTLAFTTTFSNGLALASGVLNTGNFPSGVQFDSRIGSPMGFRLTNFTNFGGSGTEGTVNLGIRYYC